MKWRYDKRFRQWWNDGWVILAPGHPGNDSKLYELQRGYNYVARFKKLASAKEVARLIEEG